MLDAVGFTYLNIFEVNFFKIHIVLESCPTIVFFFNIYYELVKTVR